MKPEDLIQYGFTVPLAKAYILILERGSLRPPELAKIIGETRTNAYTLLDKLAEYQLVTKRDVDKKLLYQANNPTSFEAFIQRQKEEILARETASKKTARQLSELYALGNEQPGVRFYTGKNGIKRIYKEQIQQGQPITYIRNGSDIDFFGFEFMASVREAAAEARIPRVCLSPHSPLVRPDWKIRERRINQKRVWFEPSDYSAPVEWSVFGNKVAAISYGEEAISMIIDSPQIAESMRQILTLLARQLKRDPTYSEPTNRP